MSSIAGSFELTFQVPDVKRILAGGFRKTQNVKHDFTFCWNFNIVSLGDIRIGS